MNNLLSYCGLVDARISASDKDLPVTVVSVVVGVSVVSVVPVPVVLDDVSSGVDAVDVVVVSVVVAVDVVVIVVVVVADFVGIVGLQIVRTAKPDPFFWVQPKFWLNFLLGLALKIQNQIQLGRVDLKNGFKFGFILYLLNPI